MRISYTHTGNRHDLNFRIECNYLKIEQYEHEDVHITAVGDATLNKEEFENVITSLRSYARSEFWNSVWQIRSGRWNPERVNDLWNDMPIRFRAEFRRPGAAFYIVQLVNEPFCRMVLKDYTGRARTKLIEYADRLQVIFHRFYGFDGIGF